MSSPGMHVTPGAESFRPSDLVHLAGRRLNLILATMLVVVALAAVVSLVLPARYTASAVVMLDPRKNNVADVSAVVSELPVDPATVQDQIQILTSRDLAGRVIDRLGLADDPEFNPALSPGPMSTLFGGAGMSEAEQRDAEVDTLLRHLTASAAGLSTAIAITYSAGDPQKAARIANAVAGVYISSEVDAKLNDTRATNDWLQARIRQLSHQVQAAEANVQAYKAEHDINETADGASLVDQQLTAINGQLVDARSDLAEKEANRGRIDSMMKGGHAGDVSQVVSSPLIVQLREQQADVIRQEADLATRYGPKHPKLIAAQNQERDLQAKIDQETARIAGTVANDVSVARAHVGSLEASLRHAETEATDQNMARVRLKALEANAASTRTMYEAFVQRLRETQSPIGIPDARVISHASAPTRPSFPPRATIVVASMPAGFMLGLLFALLAERFGGAIPAARAVSARPRVPVLAEIPGAAVARAADAAIDWPGTPFSQGVAALARQLSDPFGPRVVTVASSQPGEDSSSIAASVARVASLMGRRVAIVDANLRGPMAARILGAAPARAGLMEVLGGKAPLSQAMQRDARSGALVLSPAWAPRDPLAVLATRQMADLLAHLRGSCDLVLIDAPPVLAAAETNVLARFSDAVALIVRHAPATVVDGAVDALAAHQSPPVALVIAR
ncbi:MAG TPA: polysaccharide biosynthesis tyrosine autokinase [Rhizomicrobium sp.]|nr:polysaccharide biosynthesis tyrosine autokinase [Rhizomicrobium sp.]